MLTAPMPATLARRDGALPLISRARFRWQARRGTLDALTGQAGTLVRASTATAVDANGTTYTAGYGMPRWETRGGALGLRLSSDDLTWPCNWLPGPGTLLVRLSEAGTRTTANAGLLYLGNDGQSGGRVYIDAASNVYRCGIDNGTTGQTVSLTGATPTTGNAADLLLHLDDDGVNMRVRLARWLSGVESVTSYTSTVTRFAAWGSGTKLRANRMGSAGTQGSTWIREIAWEPGIVTYADMLARL